MTGNACFLLISSHKNYAFAEESSSSDIWVLQSFISSSLRKTWQNEVAIQRRASFWKKENRRRENPTKVSWPCPSYCRKGSQGPNWRSGQKEIFGSKRFDCRSILFPHSKKNQSKARRCFILLCQQRHSTNFGHHGIAVSRASWRGFLCLHRLLWRKRLRKLIGLISQPRRPINVHHLRKDYSVGFFCKIWRN